MTRLKIDLSYLTDQLKALLSIDSPTGYTDTIVRHVTEELERLGLKPELTRRGAIRAIRRGAQRRGARALISHLDTLGAQVKYIKDSGRLELVPVGHWSSRFAEGARVTLYTEKGSYRGTVLPLKASGHTFNEEIDTQPVSWRQLELRIDAVSWSRADTQGLGIDVGDFVAFDPVPEFLENGFIVSRYLDDKAGVAIALAALQALVREEAETPVDTHWLLTIDNGTTAPGQNSSEFGVTIAMADQSGPFDYHLTKKLVDLCREEDIRFQKDLFRYYRSDSASAIEAGHDVRTALITFGVDASHGYERIHTHALTSVAELVTAFALSPQEIERDVEEVSDIEGFTEQPTEAARQSKRIQKLPEPR